MMYVRQWGAVISASFKITATELWQNKLRTFLSLFGISIGIFCIISVLTTISSLEQNIKNELNDLGNTTIYIDKWEYAASMNGQNSRWKYVNRPTPRYQEVDRIIERTPTVADVAFKISTITTASFAGTAITNTTLYAITEKFSNIQPVEIIYGRGINPTEYLRAQPVAVIGINLAERLFIHPSNAINQSIHLNKKKVTIVGVIKKQGKKILGGWGFDDSVVIPYNYGKSFINEYRASPLIMAKGRDGVNIRALENDLTVAMRSIRKLAPREENNFALNKVQDFSDGLGSIFSNLNKGGWAIASLALIVGMFGVANIMFVSVKERTPQIGLKKALGAKSQTILAEFLLEAVFLCIAGGIIGVFFVFLLTLILSNMLSFPVFIAPANLIIAFICCIITGIISGYIPARQAAALNPVASLKYK